MSESGDLSRLRLLVFGRRSSRVEEVVREAPAKNEKKRGFFSDFPGSPADALSRLEVFPSLRLRFDFLAQRNWSEVDSEETLHILVRQTDALRIENLIASQRRTALGFPLDAPALPPLSPSFPSGENSVGNFYNADESSADENQERSDSDKSGFSDRSFEGGELSDSD